MATPQDQFDTAMRAYEADEMDVAVTLFKTLCDTGVAEACQMLGLIYRTGDGVQADVSQSKHCYEKYLVLLRRRASAGDAEAMLSLGKHYQYGEIVGIDHEKATAFIRTAANQGYSPAEFHLAVIYWHGWCGQMVDKNSFDYWIARAVSHGHPEAHYVMGINMLKSNSAGVQAQALDLIAKAANLGFWPAKDYLAANPTNKAPK